MMVPMPRKAAAIALTMVAAVSASAAPAMTALDYNVVAFGNFTSASTEVRGSLAVGNNANLSSFSIGTDLAVSFGGPSLMVGDNLTYTNGEVVRGNAVVGGQISATGFNVAAPGSANANAAVPLNFGSELTRLKTLSSSIAGKQANGNVKQTWQLVFTGTDNAVNIFNVTAAQLGASNGFAVNIPTGSVAIFNVSGSSFTTNWPGSFTLNGQTIVNASAGLASSLLFNFYDANALNFNGSWAGNVLAPTADVKLNSGGFFGSLHANNVTSSSAFYNVGFSGYDLPQIKEQASSLSPIPEPAAWGMMIGGLILVGLLMRRGKTAVNFS